MARLACIVALFVLCVASHARAYVPGTARDVHIGQDRAQKPHGDRPSDDKQPRDRWKWWLYDKADLGITEKQSAEIDKIFEETVPKQRATREELERLEDELAVLTKESKADVVTVAQLVERVENLRAKMNKTRTIMLYRFNLVLSPEQRTKVQALRERRDAERRKDSDSSRRRQH
jgi:Spy/CpxP family protein refolding chaperone